MRCERPPDGNLLSAKNADQHRMDHKTLFLYLFSLAILANCRQNHETRHRPGTKHELIKSSHKPWTAFLNKIRWTNTVGSNSDSADLKALSEEKQKHLKKPTLESSIISLAENLKIPYFLRTGNIRLSRADSTNCTCDPTYSCSTTCTSLEPRCGGTCTHFTEYEAQYYYYHNSTLLSTCVETYESSCSFTSTTCTSSTTSITSTTSTAAFDATAAALVAAAAAVAFAVGIPVGLRASEIRSQSEQRNGVNLLVEDFLSGSGFLNFQTPVNFQSIPVDGFDFVSDGCGNHLARFDDGRCYSLLHRGPCSNPRYWVTVDPITLKVFKLRFCSFEWLIKHLFP